MLLGITNTFFFFCSHGTDAGKPLCVVNKNYISKLDLQLKGKPFFRSTYIMWYITYIHLYMCETLLLTPVKFTKFPMFPKHLRVQCPRSLRDFHSASLPQFSSLHYSLHFVSPPCVTCLALAGIWAPYTWLVAIFPKVSPTDPWFYGMVIGVTNTTGWWFLGFFWELP